MAEKEKKKKVTQWAVVAGIVAVILVLWFLFKKKPVPVRSVEGELYDETAGDPYSYLTYNMGGQQQTTPKNITLGDTIINMGSGGGNFNSCAAGNALRSLPPSNVYNIGLPPPPVTQLTGGGDDYVAPDLGDMPEYTRYKCDDAKLIEAMKTAADMQGIPYSQLVEQNMYTHSEPVLKRYLQINGLPETSPIGKMYRGADVFFDPYSNKSVMGKPVRYNVQMACDCKRGNVAYCGQWLSPSLLALADDTAAA